jgi:DNA-binding GntR family transcriptional regulator
LHWPGDSVSKVECIQDCVQVNEPLSDGVYRVLVDAIVRGVLRPNERLTEQRLAEVAGASRTPIREAVRRLEAEGLIERIPHRGVTVASLPGFTEEEFKAVVRVRGAVEGELGRLAALRVSEREVDDLQAIIARAHAVPEGPHQSSELVHLNTLFHDGVNRAARSPWLLGVFASYRNLILREHWVAAHRLASPRESFTGHQEILDALRRHDAELVRTLIESHVSSGSWTEELQSLTRLAPRTGPTPLARAQRPARRRG